MYPVCTDGLSNKRLERTGRNVGVDNDAFSAGRSAAALSGLPAGEHVDARPTARLISVTDSEYAEFCAEHIVEYARQLTLAGEATADNCVAVSRERLQDLLADRLRAADHDFLIATAMRGGFRVGWVWLSPPPDFLGAGHEHTRWLSQLTVGEPHRGRGWGRAILLAAEHYLAATGVQQIWLRVFDWNLVACRLYASQGYQLATKFATDAHLRKALPQPSRPTPVCNRRDTR